jgi:hypothetical protein
MYLLLKIIQEDTVIQMILMGGQCLKEDPIQTIEAILISKILKNGDYLLPDALKYATFFQIIFSVQHNVLP